mgnify:CR=1 FL=1
MCFKLCASMVSISSICLALNAGLVNAADPINPKHESLQAFQQKFTVIIPGQSKLKSLISTPGNSLKYMGMHKDLHQTNHFRLQQQYAGYDVFGGYAIVHGKFLNQGNSLVVDSSTSVTGLVYDGLEAELGSAPLNFDKQAEDALRAFLSQHHDGEVSQTSAIPVVYIDASNQAHWAYKVSALIQYLDKIPARPTAILDAQTFNEFIQWNALKTALTPVKGQGYGGNTKTGAVEYNGAQFPFLEISRNDATQVCYMSNTGVRVIDMLHKFSTVTNSSMKFDCLDPTSLLQQGYYWTGSLGDGYDRQNGGFSPSNDALYIGYVINHLYHDWYAENALSQPDGTPMKLVMRVHYGDGYENAFWDGMSMTFGDGADFFYPLVSLGVGAHEISHGFTEQHSDLMYYGESGGMNESFSDMAAQAAEYYSTKDNTWTIGSEIVKEESGYTALRFMDLPSKDGASIDTADDYYEGLDVHYSSGVYNHLFYLLAQQTGWNTRKAFDVMIKANMDYWTPYSTFQEGACGILNATQDLGYASTAVQKVLRKVKIDAQDC